MAVEELPQPPAQDEKEVSLEEDVLPISESEQELIASVSRADDLMKTDVRGVREKALQEIVNLPVIKELLTTENLSETIPIVIAAIEEHLRLSNIPSVFKAGENAEVYGEVVGMATEDI